MEKEMLANVTVTGSVLGRILNTYTADPVKWIVIVAGVGSEGKGVASCQVPSWGWVASIIDGPMLHPQFSVEEPRCHVLSFFGEY